MKCFPRDLLLLFNMTWNDHVFKMNQVLEPGPGSQAKYFLQSKGSKMSLRFEDIFHFLLLSYYRIFKLLKFV